VSGFPAQRTGRQGKERRKREFKITRREGEKKKNAKKDTPDRITREASAAPY
jgi:hypothetical protein